MVPQNILGSQKSQMKQSWADERLTFEISIKTLAVSLSMMEKNTEKRANSKAVGTVQWDGYSKEIVFGINRRCGEGSDKSSNLMQYNIITCAFKEK